MESDTAEDDVVLAAEEAVNAEAVEKAVNTKTAQEIDYAEEAEDVEASEKDSATKIAEHAVVSVNEVKLVDYEEIGVIDAEEARLNDKTLSNKDSNIDNNIDGEEFRDFHKEYTERKPWTRPSKNDEEFRDLGFRFDYILIILKYFFIWTT